MPGPWSYAVSCVPNQHTNLIAKPAPVISRDASREGFGPANQP
jgi:hypothetical protein